MDFDIGQCYEIIHPLRAYLFIATTVVLFAAKDFVILQLWTASGKLLGLCLPKRKGTKAPKAEQNKNKNKLTKKDRRRITCREISDLIFSVFMAAITLYVLASTKALTGSLRFNVQALELVPILLSIHFGKMLFRAFFHCFVEFGIIQLIHWTILSVCYGLFLGPCTSPVVGVIGLVCDAADVHRHLVGILDAWDEPYYSRRRIGAHAVGVAAAVLFRCLLPVGLLAVVIHQGCLGSLSQSGVVLFFFFLTYLASVNLFWTVYVVTRLRGAINQHQLYKATELNSVRTLKFVLEMKKADIRYQPKENSRFFRLYQEGAAAADRQMVPADHHKLERHNDNDDEKNHEVAPAS